MTNWSKTGIGFWLLQKHCICDKIKPFCCPTGWHTTLVGSHFTQSNESHYAPIEGEALAVADGLKKSRFFVLGCSKLIVAVDHKPLLKIFGDPSLNDIENPRLLNLKEKTLQYRFEIIHIPGAKNHAADALSRHPSHFDPFSMNEKAHLDDNLKLAAIASIKPLKAIAWNDVKEATNSDDTMLLLLNTIKSGFPTLKKNLPSILPSPL